MICPKCGHENADNELFCEECDFRMDQKPPRAGGIGKDKLSVYLGFASLIFGVAAALCMFLEYGVAAIVFGVIGMMIGGYSMTVVRVTDVPQNVRVIMLIVIAVAIVTSVIGFLRGFIMVF